MFLVLFMVSCGGGSSSDYPTPSGNKSASVAYTIHGTVSGLQGSGLVLQIFEPGHGGSGNYKNYNPGYDVGPPYQITSNGSFTLVRSAPGAGVGFVGSIAQQPASPNQTCFVSNSIDEQTGIDTNVDVNCSQYAYVANAGDGTISTFTVDPASGELAAVGAPVATGTSPRAIAGTPDRTYLFVANEGTHDISVFSIDDMSGELRPMSGSPVPVGTGPRALAYVTAFGEYRHLYVANAGSDTLSVFDFDTSGSLTPQSPATVATGRGPSAILPVGQTLLYVANSGGSNDMSAFWTRTSESTSGSTFPVGGNPVNLAQAGSFLYSANPDATSPTISGFSMDLSTGALTPLSGSPFPLPAGHGIASAFGEYLYVTSGDYVVGYAINPANGALTPLPGFPVSAGANAYAISIDSNDQFLYVANEGGASISGFRLDAATGALAPLPDSPFAAGDRPDFIATL